MSEAVQFMNGRIWIFSFILIGWVIFQGIMFIRLALNFNKKNNVATAQEIKSAAKSGAIAVIGPCISSIVVALTLMGLVGPALALMRQGIIGSDTWDLMMGNIAADTIGVAFNTPEFTREAFVLVMFGMALGSSPYFINVFLTLKPLDKATISAQKTTDSGKKKESFIPYLGSAAIMGILGYSLIDHLSTVPKAMAFITAAAICYCMIQLAKKTGKAWIQEWEMALALVGGMVFGQVILMILS